MKILAVISLSAMILCTTGVALAEDYGKIIEECEDLFPELEELGKAKFEQRYIHFKKQMFITALSFCSA